MCGYNLALDIYKSRDLDTVAILTPYLDRRFNILTPYLSSYHIGINTVSLV